ncbi:MAG: hypothetical protein U0703_24645 [Anaerolineae bacterium]
MGVVVSLNSLTPEFFDTLIVVVIILGIALAVVRLYADFTRPLPPEENEDTRPTQPVLPDDKSA